MAFLIDTNIAIHAGDSADWALDRLAKNDGAVVLSALSLAELQRGLYKDPANTASILVTDNVGDFRDIPGLTIETWKP